MPAPTRFLNPNRPVRASHLEMTQLSKMINRRRWRPTVLAAWLVVTGLSPNLTAAQDVKVNLGSGDDSEKAKQNKELADKLRPEQQAAYLNRVQAWSSVESIVGSAALVGLPLGIVAMVLTFRHRRQKLAHETMRLMIEKGLSVPPELINPPPPIKPPKNDLRRGAVWLAIGLALLVGMKEHMEDWWSFALIPTFMGVAYLACWFVARNGERQNGQADRLWRGVFWTLFGVALIIAIRAMQHANGDWDRIADWWSVGLIPTAIGAAFLLHNGILWLIERKKTAQGYSVAFSDGDLIARVLEADDPNAFAELVRRYQSPVRVFLRRMTRGDEALADDLAQETFIRAWRKLESYRNESRFSTWLFGIAVNEFRGRARRVRRLREEQLDESSAGPEPANFRPV